MQIPLGMQTRSWFWLAAGVLVSVLALSCAAQPQETKVNDAASTKRRAKAKADARKSRQRASQRFGYSWTLPKDWQFVDPGLFWAFPPTPAYDVYAAQHSADGPFILMIATDVIHTIPGRHAGHDAKDYDRLERDGAKTLEQAHAKLTSIERVQAFGVETVEVKGEQGKLRIIIRSLFVGYRKFEFRCFQLAEQSECGPALSEFIIEDLPEPAGERSAPQVRHLHDAGFGVAFDAPDDSWLSTGPFVARGGTQVVWIWSKSGQQIDVQVMDLEAMPRQPDQAEFAARMARSARESGHRVFESQTAFAGQLWDHHEMSRKGSGEQDLFVLVQQGVMYSVLVTQPTRDPRLIDAAKNGFRLIARAASPAP